MENNRSLLFQIFYILKKYSSEEHSLNIGDITQKMVHEFRLEKEPNRKTITSHLEELLRLTDEGLLDSEIIRNQKNIKRVTYYYVTRLPTLDLSLKNIAKI